jgi:hypothetical protein
MDLTTAALVLACMNLGLAGYRAYKYYKSNKEYNRRMQKLEKTTKNYNKKVVPEEVQVSAQAS